MRRIILFISLLVLPAALAVAQYGSYGERHNDRDQGRNSDRGGNRLRVEGCLYGQPGDLALTDDQGNTFELRGRMTRRLDDVIGHRVRVEGRTWFNADNPNAMSENGEAVPVLRVIEIENISRQYCGGGGGDEFRLTIPIH